MRKVYITAYTDEGEFHLVFSCNEGFQIADSFVRKTFRGRLTSPEKDGEVTVEQVDEIRPALAINSWEITDSK